MSSSYFRSWLEILCMWMRDFQEMDVDACCAICLPSTGCQVPTYPGSAIKENHGLGRYLLAFLFSSFQSFQWARLSSASLYFSFFPPTLWVLGTTSLPRTLTATQTMVGRSLLISLATCLSLVVTAQAGEITQFFVGYSPDGGPEINGCSGHGQDLANAWRQLGPVAKIYS